MIEPCWTVPELRKRGWTDRLIRKLLGEPDEIKRSLHFWKAPPTQLYACDRVHRSRKRSGLCRLSSKPGEALSSQQGNR